MLLLGFSSLGFGLDRHVLNVIVCLGNKENTGKIFLATLLVND